MKEMFPSFVQTSTALIAPQIFQIAGFSFDVCKMTRVTREICLSTRRNIATTH
jgi:hypothetical protein